MNYLCLDYGAKHTGIAISTTSIAEPLTTLATSALTVKLPSIINQHSINHLIIGLPQGKHRYDVLDLKHSLESHLNLPVTLHDETLSSRQAKDRLTHTKKSVRSGPDHHFAAALILQDYLDTHQPI